MRNCVSWFSVAFIIENINHILDAAFGIIKSLAARMVRGRHGLLAAGYHVHPGAHHHQHRGQDYHRYQRYTLFVFLPLDLFKIVFISPRPYEVVTRFLNQACSTKI